MISLILFNLDDIFHLKLDYLPVWMIFIDKFKQTCGFACVIACVYYFHHHFIIVFEFWIDLMLFVGKTFHFRLMFDQNAANAGLILPFSLIIW